MSNNYRLEKYKEQLEKLILDEAPDEEFSKLMTEMEKEFNIPLLKDENWNNDNRILIELYETISDQRRLQKDLEDDWGMEI